MISGPVHPRNRAGLWELIERRLDEIESGMVLVARDLELEPGCAVDALAKDGAGRPVLLFLADPEDRVELPARLLAARAWLGTGTPLLARFVPHDGLDYGQPPRLVAVGFELSTGLLEQLAALGAGAVEVYQVRSLRIGGRARVALLPLLGAAALGEEDTFALPSGVRGGPARTLGVRFLDLLRRLEPNLQVAGDRYARRFCYAGSLLAELCLRDGAVRVRVPPAAPAENGAAADPAGPADVELRSPDDCREAADRVLRRYLDLLGTGRHAAGLEPLEAERLARVTAPEHRPAPTLEQLRHTVDTSHLSPEEYSVLGESGPDDEPERH